MLHKTRPVLPSFDPRLTGRLSRRLKIASKGASETVLSHAMLMSQPQLPLYRNYLIWIAAILALISLHPPSVSSPLSFFHSSKQSLNPSLHHPSLHHPSLHHPSLHHPSLHHPSLHHPSLHHPSLHHPSLHHPSLHHPSLHHPSLHHPSLHHPSLHQISAFTRLPPSILRMPTVPYIDPSAKQEPMSSGVLTPQLAASAS
ncbi:unnamed protein product [Closterium sp. NIES-54]